MHECDVSTTMIAGPALSLVGIDLMTPPYVHRLTSFLRPSLVSKASAAFLISDFRLTIISKAIQSASPDSKSQPFRRPDHRPGRSHANRAGRLCSYASHELRIGACAIWRPIPIRCSPPFSCQLSRHALTPSNDSISVTYQWSHVPEFYAFMAFAKGNFMQVRALCSGGEKSLMRNLLLGWPHPHLPTN